MPLFPLGELHPTLYQVHRTVITRGLQIGPMRKRALHFLNITSSVYHVMPLYAYTHFSFHTNLLHSLAPMISTVSLLNDLLSMPMTQRCLVLCFTILHLRTTESPKRFSFFLNKPLNGLWFYYSNKERYLFPAESLLTLHLWNKAIFSYLILFISCPCKQIDIAISGFRKYLLKVNAAAGTITAVDCSEWSRMFTT